MSDKIIPINFDKKKEEEKKVLDSQEGYDFLELMKQNEKKQKKLKDKRSKANKGVIKSYRLRPN